MATRNLRAITNKVSDVQPDSTSVADSNEISVSESDRFAVAWIVTQSPTLSLFGSPSGRQQRMLDEMSASRNKVCEEIGEADAAMTKWQDELAGVNEEIRRYERESWNALDEFRSQLPRDEDGAAGKKAASGRKIDDDSALSIRIEHRDDVSDLEVAVKYRTKKIESDMRVLENRTNHLNTYKYVRRISEIVQLQMILKSANLKKFYEYFVKFVNIAFTEISYAHTVFEKCAIHALRGNEKSAVNSVWLNKKEGIANLSTIQYIASITPGDVTNEVSYENTLMEICSEMQSYICSLPDRDAVVYHVARHLTTHRIRRAEIEQIGENDEETMIKCVNQRVHEWIRALLSAKFSSDEHRSAFSAHEVEPSGSSELMRSASVTSDSFGLIAASQQDILAQVRTSRAASIVLHRVYGIHLDI